MRVRLNLPGLFLPGLTTLVMCYMVQEALAFYETHQAEVDAAIAAEWAFAALDRLLSETEAEDWIGQVRWLNR